MLYGRSDAQQVLADLVAAARVGRSGVHVLRGEAGIGKTALLDEVVASAPGVRTIRMAAPPAEMELGFAGLHQLLVPLLAGRERLPPRQSDALGAAFGLGDSLPADLFLIGLATLTLLAEAAGAADQPLLCVVDDAHWLDRESLDVLAFVGHRLDVESVVLLFAARDAGRAAGPSPLDGFPQLRLDGLADDAARQLLAATVTAPVADGVAERLLAETGGNPLAIVELTRELTSAQLTGDEVLPERLPLPERLAAHFLDQVRHLPADTQTLLLVAAAEPSGDAAVLWRAASELGIGRDAVLAAQQARLVALGDRVAFRHPLIRSATYLGAPAAERQRVHRALATATGSPQRVERRAAHLAAASAGPDDTVAGELEEAAAAARRRGSHAEVVDMLTRSAELTPEPRVRARRFLAAARAALAGGAPHRVQPLLDQARPDLVEGVDRAEAQRVEGLALGMLGRTGGAPELLVAAARALEPLDVRRARDTWLEAMSAAASPQAGGQPTVVEVAELVLAAPSVPEGQATVNDLVLDGMATRLAVGHTAAVRLLRAALAVDLPGGLPPEAVPTAFLLADYAARELLDDEAESRLLTRFTRWSREHGALSALRSGLRAVGRRAIRCGDFATADACAAECRDITRSIGGDPDHDDLVVVELHAWRGRTASTHAAVAVITRAAGTLQDQALALRAQMVLELGGGSYAHALVPGRRLLDEDAPVVGTQTMPDVVEAAVRSGDHGTARAALDRLEERLPMTGSPWADGLLARSRALLAPDAEAEPLHRQAIDDLSRTEVRTDLARAHLLYGEWLRRRRRRLDARAQLRAAHEMFTAMGAGGFAERARAELVATGAKARKRTVDAAGDLTPQEEQVARLAAQGATNGEIATQLFVSAATVDYHLRKVFRKLGITSRRQLGRALPRHAAGRDR